jgi:hypothetical protein
MKLFALGALLAATIAFGFQGKPAAPTYAKDVKPTLDRYCTGCHAGANAPDKVDFFKIKTEVDAKKNLKMLQKSFRKLSKGEMPPKGMPKPTAAQRASFDKWLKARGKK